MNNVKVENQYFINIFIQPSKKLWDISPKEAHYCYESPLGQKVYFKRKQFTKIQNTQQVKESADLVKSQASQFVKQFNLSQQHLSKYLLTYSSLIISYPYACFIHKNIINLASYIKSIADFSIKVDLMMLIAQGIEDLHQKSIIIQNLTSSTILIIQNAKEKTIQIAFQNMKFQKNKYLDSFCSKEKKQNNVYTAPQIRENDNSQSKSSNIWSLGLIYYEILFGKKVSTQDILNSDYQVFSKNRSSWIYNFLHKMLNQSPKSRYNIQDVIRLLKNAQLCSNQVQKYF